MSFSPSKQPRGLGIGNVWWMELDRLWVYSGEGERESFCGLFFFLYFFLCSCGCGGIFLQM